MKIPAKEIFLTGKLLFQTNITSLRMEVDRLVALCLGWLTGFSAFRQNVMLHLSLEIYLKINVIFFSKSICIFL